MSFTHAIQRDVFYRHISEENKEETVKAIREEEAYIPLFLEYTESHSDWSKAHESYIDSVISEIKLQAINPSTAQQVHQFVKSFWSQAYQELEKSEQQLLSCIKLHQESHGGVVNSYLYDHKELRGEWASKAVYYSYHLCDAVFNAMTETEKEIFNFELFLEMALFVDRDEGVELYFKHCPMTKQGFTKSILFNALHKNPSILRQVLKMPPVGPINVNFFITICPIDILEQLLLRCTLRDLANCTQLIQPDRLSILNRVLTQKTNQEINTDVLASLFQNQPFDVVYPFIANCEPEKREVLLTTRTHSGQAPVEIACSRLPLREFTKIIEFIKNKEILFGADTLLLHNVQDQETLTFLLEQCADEQQKINLFQSKDHTGKSPLFSIAQKDPHILSEALKACPEPARENFYAPSSNGNTIMHMNIPVECVETLLRECPAEHKPRFYQANQEGKFPFSQAIIDARVASLSLLCEHCPKEYENAMDQELLQYFPHALSVQAMLASPPEMLQAIYNIAWPRVDLFQQDKDGKTIFSHIVEKMEKLSTDYSTLEWSSIRNSLEWIVSIGAVHHIFSEDGQGKSIYSAMLQEYKTSSLQEEEHRIYANLIFQLPQPFPEKLKNDLENDLETLATFLITSPALQEQQSYVVFEYLFENVNFVKNAFRWATSRHALQILFDMCPVEKREELLFNKDERGTTPLFDLATKASPEAIVYYLEGRNVQIAPDNNGETPLHYACRSDNPKRLAALLGSADRRDVLFQAHEAALGPLRLALEQGRKMTAALLKATTEPERERLYAESQDIFTEAVENYSESLLSLIQYAPASQRAKLLQFNVDAIFTKMTQEWPTMLTLRLILSLPDPIRAPLEARWVEPLHKTPDALKQFVEFVLTEGNKAALLVFQIDAMLKALLASEEFTTRAVRELDQPEELEAILSSCTELQKKQVLLNRDSQNMLPYVSFLTKEKSPQYVQAYLNATLPLDVSILFERIYESASGRSMLPIEHLMITGKPNILEVIIAACPPTSKDELFAAIDLADMAHRGDSDALTVLLEKASGPQRALLYARASQEMFLATLEKNVNNAALLFTHAPEAVLTSVFATIFTNQLQAGGEKFSLLVSVIPSSSRKLYEPHLKEAVEAHIDLIENLVLNEENDGNVARMLAEPFVLSALLIRTSFTEAAFRKANLARIIIEENQEAVKAFIEAQGGFEKLSAELRLSLLPLHTPSQIRQTIADVNKHVKSDALDKVIPLNENNVSIRSAFSILAKDVVKINWSLAANTIQEKIKEVLFKQISLQDLSYAAAEGGLQKTIGLYWRLCNEMELAVLIPQLSPKVFVKTLKTFPSLAAQTGYLHFATLEQREAFLEKTSLHKLDFPDWEACKEHFEAAVEANNVGNAKYVVDEFVKYSRELTLLTNPIVQMRRLKQTLSTGETSEAFLDKVEIATKHAIDRIEGIKRDLAELRSLVMAFYVEPETETIPPAFIDPITEDVMKMPMILPGMGEDKTVIDVSSIPKAGQVWTNPFNRQEYNSNDFVLDTELKRQIDAWKEEQKPKSEPSL